jgi:hypothetical protein
MNKAQKILIGLGIAGAVGITMLLQHLEVCQKPLIWMMMKILNNSLNITVDQVNNPLHYTTDPSGVECIEITRHRNFNIGNAFKYLWRAGLKDEEKTIQDLEKAIFYIKDEINRLEGKYVN